MGFSSQASLKTEEKRDTFSIPALDKGRRKGLGFTVLILRGIEDTKNVVCGTSARSTKIADSFVLEF